MIKIRERKNNELKTINYKIINKKDNKEELIFFYHLSYFLT